TRDWSAEMFESLELEPELFPKTFEGTAVNGTVSDLAAVATGLQAGTPVVGGGGDQAANGVGVGAIEPGVVAVSIGTSGVVFAASATPVVEPEGRLHAFCHALPDTWHLMGVMLSAAGSYRWFKDELAPGLDFADLDQAVSEIRPGADGLVFLPYLTGERTPHPDPEARGAFVGLTVRHGLGHMTRAVMEGVAFGLRDSVDLMARQLDLGEVRVSGGGASSPVWLQVVADVLDRPVRVVGTAESAAHGAAILAAAGTGGFASVAEACNAAVELGDIIEPSSSAAAYDDVYGVYRDLYPALRESFHRLTGLDS
ncbi:MAG: xylulokinase, partial [Acidimicrobiia bacterium]|nr:xylulokinase [Acidimicrobiia bacterium]